MAVDSQLILQLTIDGLLVDDGWLLVDWVSTGSQSADTLIKALIDRLVDNPHETQDLEILCCYVDKCKNALIKLLAQKCKKGFLLIIISIYTAAG